MPIESYRCVKTLLSYWFFDNAHYKQMVMYGGMHRIPSL